MEDTLKNDNKDTNVQPQDLTEHIDPNLPKEYIENKETPEDLDITWTRWKCLKCGYVYEGVNELKKCPKCGNEDPDFLIDVD